MMKINEAVEKVEEGVEHLGEKANLVQAEVKVTALKAKKKAQEALDDAKAYVQKHPAEVMGATLALGAILGWLLGRRRQAPTIPR